MHRITRIFALTMIVASTCLAGGPSREDSFSVMGPVKNPGIYILQQDATIISAIDTAGGEEATKELKVTVVRKIDDKLTQEISFSSLKSLREHPTADVPILKNDIIVLTPITAK